jgi:hypothetical protein
MGGRLLEGPTMVGRTLDWQDELGRKGCPRKSMISLDDCIALCGLTEEEVLAIAEHEHLPEIAAATLAQYLIHEQHGLEKIRDMIIDGIRAAQLRGDQEHVLTLLHVLHHFLKSFPTNPFDKLSSHSIAEC